MKILTSFTHKLYDFYGTRLSLFLLSVCLCGVGESQWVQMLFSLGVKKEHMLDKKKNLIIKNK